MKKERGVRLFLLLFCLLFSSGTNAETITENGIEYELIYDESLTPSRQAYARIVEVFADTVSVPEEVLGPDQNAYVVTALKGHKIRDYMDNLFRLREVSLPNTLVSLGDSCFIRCYNLNSISIPEGVTSLGKCCFQDCNKLTSVVMPEGVTSLGDYCFVFCYGLSSITIPSSMVSLGKCCFGSCGLTSITIQEGVSSLGDYCFQDCKELSSVTIPTGVTSLGEGCFLGCMGLSSVAIAEGVISLGDKCFSVCPSLTSVTLPASVASLGDECFYGCSSLTKITIRNPEPPFVYGYLFEDEPNSALVYVPSESVGRYKSTDIWLEYDIRPLPKMDGGDDDDDGDLSVGVDDILSHIHSDKFEIYDLQGRLVANPREGEFYIVNGQKLLWKD